VVQGLRLRATLPNELDENTGRKSCSECHRAHKLRIRRYTLSRRYRSQPTRPNTIAYSLCGHFSVVSPMRIRVAEKFRLSGISGWALLSKRPAESP
jgi:hypothetical protein